MPDGNHESRLSTAEANIENLKENYSKSLDEIKGVLEKIFTQNGEIKTGLAVVVNNQNAMTDYQKKCDTDRTDIKADAAKLEKRVTETEGFQKRVLKLSSSVSGVIAVVVTAGVEWIRK